MALGERPGMRRRIMPRERFKAGDGGRSSSARSGLFLIVDKGANAFNNRGLAFFKDFFVFFEKIASLGVNRADQGAKLFHPHHPHGFGHAEFRPLMVFDLFNTGGGNDGAAAREDAVDCLFSRQPSSVLGPMPPLPMMSLTPVSSMNSFSKVPCAWKSSDQ